MAEQNTYKESFKATSLFGGVQVFNIVIQIIRSKFVALLLGTSGMGIVGLFNSTITLLSSLTSLGLSSSAVRNISAAKGEGNQDKVLKIIRVFRCLVWITGLLGLVVCVILSPLLSQWTFGNRDYTVGFIILSITLLLQQLTSGQTSIMQGLHKYQFMAKSNVIGNTIGLFVTIPLYYIWGIDAIVPVLVLTSLTALVLSLFYYKKINIESRPVDMQVMKTEGKNMAIMGVTLSLSGISETIIAYIIRVFISKYGGLDDVGLYSAGFAIVTTYVGLIFTAMGTDFYPRLSEASNNNDKFNEIINSQMEIALLILAPILCIFVIFIELIIVVLYSGKFLPSAGLMYWSIFGTFFKAVSWSIAFSFLAKGDAKAFIANELGAKLYTLPSQLFGFYYGGLTGIGLAYLFNYIVYTIQVFIICRLRYGIKINMPAFKIFIEQLPLIGACLVFINCANGFYIYIYGMPIILISVIITYKELDKRIGIKESLNQILNKIK